MLAHKEEGTIKCLGEDEDWKGRQIIITPLAKVRTGLGGVVEY